jgi:hypothetical protein
MSLSTARNPDADWHYDFHHRQGVIAHHGQVSNLDAMDITAPYTAGALRGGSHVHVFSPNGQLVSFTYNDHVCTSAIRSSIYATSAWRRLSAR